jgi:hypothetical protein
LALILSRGIFKRVSFIRIVSLLELKWTQRNCNYVIVHNERVDKLN